MSNYDVLNESRKELVNTIIELMKQEGLNWTKCWASAVRPYNPVSDIRYRGGNKIRLSVAAYVNEYVDPRWITYKQAQAHGWQVKKGSQGVRLEKWIFEKVETITDPATGEEKKQKVSLDRPIPYHFTVFNAEQISGIPELEIKDPLPRDEMFKLAADVVASSECQVKRTGLGCFYVPDEDTLYLPPADTFYSNEGYLATALHEMAHSTGHASRLNRDIINNFGSSGYAKEELVAELASAFTQQQLELDLSANIDNHAAYLQSWIKILESDPNELYRAATEAEKASDRLIYNYELYKELNADLPSPEKKELISELDMFLDQYLPSSEAVDINTLRADVIHGDIQKYLDMLAAYRDNNTGIRPSELIQICSLARKLELNAPGNEPSEHWNLNAAVESTDDYSDIYFHANMNNTSGQGKEDYYRIVYVNDYGDVQPLTDHVFRTHNEASEHMASIDVVKERSYDRIIYEAQIKRLDENVMDIRNEYKERLKNFKLRMSKSGWDFTLAQGEKTYWHSINASDRRQEMEFESFLNLEDYLDDIEHIEVVPPGEPRRYNDQRERLYGSKTAAEFTREDIKKFLNETERHMNNPDPKIGVSEMNKYGYMGKEMLPLTKERAVYLFEAEGLPIYKLYVDNTEAQIKDLNEFEHKGLFGIKDDAWNKYITAPEPELEDEIEETYTEDDVWTEYTYNQGEFKDLDIYPSNQPDFFKGISKNKSNEKTSITERLATKKAEIENNHKETPNLQRSSACREFMPDL